MTQSQSKITPKMVNLPKFIIIILSLMVLPLGFLPMAIEAQPKLLENQVNKGEQEPIRYSGSCQDNSTWIENPKDNSENSIAYFVKNDNRIFSSTDTPITSPNKYYKQMCISNDRVNYKDEKGILRRINNQFVTKIETKDVVSFKGEKINGKLESIKSTKTISQTYYVNTGNDYIAKFSTDPNQGFYFKTKKDSTGVEFEVIKVSIGTKELKANTPTYKDNVLTYPEVAEGVDLQYNLNTNGIAKFFVIKNAEAVKKTDLTTFIFDLADNTKIQKKDEKFEEINSILKSKGISSETQPILTKINNGEEIKPETKINLTNEISNKLSKLEEIKLNEEVKGDNINTDLLRLTNKLINSNTDLNADLKNNKLNIQETEKLKLLTSTVDIVSVGTEKLILESNPNKVQIELPTIFDQKNEGLNNISSKVSTEKNKLTIKIENDYLTDSTRKFPIYVDPTIVVAQISQDTTVFSRNKNQKFGGKHHLSAGGETRIKVGGDSYGLDASRALLKFQIPDELFTGVEVLDAKLSVYQYDGNGIRLLVNNLHDFEESQATWNNQPLMAENRGEMWAANNTDRNNTWIKSSNISSLLNDNIKIPGNRITRIGLMDDAEPEGRNGLRSVVFCSKEATPGHQCNGSKNPNITIIYTHPPLKLNNVLPDASDFVTNCQSQNASDCKSDAEKLGSCDLSKSYNCALNTSINHDVKNVNSGGDSEPSFYRLGVTNLNSITNYSMNGIDTINQYGKTGGFVEDHSITASIDGRSESVPRDSFGTGVYRNINISAENLDQWGAGWRNSESKITYHQVDNGSPVAYSNIDVTGTKNKDSNYLIGRSNPENTTPQVKFNAPEYQDAMFSKFAVRPTWQIGNSGPLIMDVSGGFNPYDIPASQGKSIQASGVVKYNPEAQQFAQDGTVIRANGSDLCWDENRGDGDKLVIARCTGADNQRFIYDPTTKQFKLLDNGIEFSTIELLGIPNKVMDIWGNNDNQTLIKIGGVHNGWNQRFNYNPITKQIKNSAGKCLDIGNGNLGDNLRIQDCYGVSATNQQFIYDAKSRIKAVNNTLCVDSFSYANEASRLYMWDCHEGGNQKFKINSVIDSTEKGTNLKNAIHCVEGNSIDGVMRVKNCSDSQYQKFDIDKIDNVRIKAPGTRNDKGVNQNSLQYYYRDGIDRRVFANNDNLIYQNFSYNQKTNQIRTLENECLDLHLNTIGYIFLGGCNGGDNQKWDEKLINNTRVIVSRYKINGLDYCLSNNGSISDPTGDKSKFTFVSKCTGASNQEFSFEQYSKFMFPNNEIKYQARIAENLDGLKTGISTDTAKVITIPWQTSKEFQFNSNASLLKDFEKTKDPITDKTLITLKLEDGKNYFVSIQAKDRSTETANISDWTEPQRIYVDTSLPIVEKLTLKNTINSKEIIIDAKDANISTIKVYIKNSQGEVLSTLTNCYGINPNVGDDNYDVTKLGNVGECKNNGNIVANKTTRFVLPFDGKDKNGVLLKDGNYNIAIEVMDLSGNSNIPVTNMTLNSNGVQSTTPAILTLVSSIPMAITYPNNMSWVNKSEIPIRGSVMRNGSTNGEGNVYLNELDRIELFKTKISTNANSTEFGPLRLTTNELNNFEQNVKLDLGQNTFGLNSYDKNGNKANQIGNEKLEKWTIFREQTPPTIQNIEVTPKSKYSVDTIDSSTIKINFQVIDGSALQDQFSGFGSTINSKYVYNNFDFSLLRTLDDNNYREIPLYKNGVNISDPNPNPRIANEVVCTSNSMSISNDLMLESHFGVSCEVVIQNLNLDAQYKFHLKARDNAGNTACTRHTPNIEKALSKDMLCEVSSTTNSQSDISKLFKIKTSNYINPENTSNYSITAIDPSTINLQSNSGISTASKTHDVTINAEQDAQIKFRNYEGQIMIYSVVDLKSNRIKNFDLSFENYLSTEYIDFNNFDKTKYKEVTPQVPPLILKSNTCNSKIDNDGSKETPDITICKVSLTINLKVKDTNVNTINLINLHSTKVVNSNLLRMNIFTNQFNVTAISSSNTSVVSPDGDGNFDDITFQNKITVGGTTTPIPFSSKFDYSIIDSKTNLPFFMGKFKDINEFNNFRYNAKYQSSLSSSPVKLPDGEYYYQFTYLNEFNNNLASNKTSFKVVSASTSFQKPTIITPTTNFTTTRGVINVQGIGPISINKDASQVVDIEICARLTNKSNLNTLTVNECATQTRVRTNSKGFYSVLVTLPFEKNEYIIEARAIRGQEKSELSTVTVFYDIPDSIKSLNIVSSIEGLNTKDELACLLENKSSPQFNCTSDFTIKNAKMLTITTQVAKGTEALEIDFADLTKINKFPGTDQNKYQGQFQGKRIAIINNRTEVSPRLNPTNDLDVKANRNQEQFSSADGVLYVNTGKDLSNNVVKESCQQEMCTWEYRYAIPYIMDGSKYEVRVRSYRGETVQEATKGFEINGLIQAKPTILRTDKVDLTNKCQYVIAFDKANCSDTETYINKSLNVKFEKLNDQLHNTLSGFERKDNNQAVIPVYYTNKPDIKIWVGANVSDKLNYSYKELNTSNPEYSTNISTDKSGKAGVDIKLDSEISSMNNVKYYKFNISRLSSNGIPQNNQSTTAIIILDRRPPELQNVITTNTSTTQTNPAINPWVRNGDQVKFQIESNESLEYGYIISETGYRSMLNKDMSKTISNCTQFTQLDIKSAIFTNDKNIPTECINDYYSNLTASADLTIQRPTLEGVYYPTIYLQDLAGNGIVIDNSADLVYKNLIEITKINLKKTVAPNAFEKVFKSLAGQQVLSKDFYDYDNLVYAQHITFNPNDQFIIDGKLGADVKPVPNIYSGQPRAKSLDFRLLIDNTRPIKSEINFAGIGDTIKIIDPVTKAVKEKIVTDGIHANTNPGSIEIDRMQGNIANPNLGYSLVTRNNQVELRMKVEQNQRINLTIAERKDAYGNLGQANAYSQSKTYTPSSTTYDKASCTNEPNKNKFLMRNGIFFGYDTADIFNVKTWPIKESYDYAKKDKIGYGGVVTQFVTYCDFIFTYDFNNRFDSYGNPIKTTGKGESPNGYALDNIELSFYPVDLAGNAPVTDEEYSKSLDPNSLNGVKPLQSCSFGEDGQVTENLNLATVKYSRSVNSVQSCPVKIYYDQEAPLTKQSEAELRNKKQNNQALPTQGIGNIFNFSNITSTSYNNNSIPDLIGGKGTNQQNQLDMSPNAVNGESNQFAITKDSKIDVTTSGEARADVIIGLSNSKNEPLSIQDTPILLTKGNNNGVNRDVYYNLGKWYYADNNQLISNELITSNLRKIKVGNIDKPTTTSQFTLANQGSKSPDTRDDDINKKSSTNQTCATNSDNLISSPIGTIPAIKNRRIGTCDDGLYKVKAYAVDTAGNYVKDSNGNPQWTDRVVERDTVNPSKPNLEVNHILDPIDIGQASSVKPNYLGTKIIGEANAIVNINITSSRGLNQNFDLKTNSNGVYETQDLIGSLPCGEVTFKLKVTLTDRAGNRSIESDTKSITTKQCAVCAKYQLVGLNGRVFQALGESAKGFVNPTGRNLEPTSVWGYSSSYSFGRHSGVDFPLTFGEPIFAAKGGKVHQASRDADTSWGTPGSLTTIIDHGEGIFTAYYHQSLLQVTEGQIVKTGQQIGLTGDTGYAKGPHLHFEVRINSPAFGNDVEPMQFIRGSNTTSTEMKSLETVKSNSVSKVNKISVGNVSEQQSSYINCSIPDLAAEEGELSLDDDEDVNLSSENETMNASEISNISNQFLSFTNTSAKKIFDASSLCMKSFNDVLPKLSFENVSGILKYAIDYSVEELANEVIKSCGLSRDFISNINSLKVPEFIKSIINRIKELFYSIIRVIDFVLTPIRWLVKVFQNENIKNITKLIGSIIIGVTMAATCIALTAASAGMLIFLNALCAANIFASISLFNNLVDLLECMGIDDSNSEKCIEIIKALAFDVGLLIIGGIFKALKSLSSQPFVKKIGAKVFDSSKNIIEDVGRYICSPKTNLCKIIASCGNCFVAGTLILIGTNNLQIYANSLEKTNSASQIPLPTEFNTKSIAIENVVKGDWVVSRNEKDLLNDEPTKFAKVTNTIIHSTSEKQELVFRNKNGLENIINTTPNHPFYSINSNSNGNWEEAANLQINSKFSNNNLTLISNKLIESHIPIKVYNLEVNNTHTYYISSKNNNLLNNKIWVHNTKVCDVLNKIKTITSKDGGMLGKNGSLLQGSKSFPINKEVKFQGKDVIIRVDIENFSPGIRPANIHLQQNTSNGDGLFGKHHYDPVSNKLYEKVNNEFVESGTKYQKLLNNEDVAKAIKKALGVLGE